MERELSNGGEFHHSTLGEVSHDFIQEHPYDPYMRRQACHEVMGRLLQSFYRESLFDDQDLVDLEHQPRLEFADGSALRFASLKCYVLRALRVCFPIEYRKTRHTAWLPLRHPVELLEAFKPLLKPRWDQWEHVDRFSYELGNSVTNDTYSRTYRRLWNTRLHLTMQKHGWDDLLTCFMQNYGHMASLKLEQWGCIGHPWHPNHKAKPGLSAQEVQVYGPEFEAQILLRMVAVQQTHLHQSVMPDFDAASCLPDVHESFVQALHQRGLSTQDWAMVLVHPWQYEHSLPEHFADLLRAGKLILLDEVSIPAQPSMSFRTVRIQGTHRSYFIKLPISVRLTSVYRTLSAKSAVMGPRISRLLQDILAQDPGIASHLSILPEYLGSYVQTGPEREDRSRHLSYMLRDVPENQLQEHQLAVPVGALFAKDHQGVPLLIHVLQYRGKSQNSEDLWSFFQEYSQALIQSLVALYARYGIALEGHQQNSFIVLDQHEPLRFLVRDFGDVRIHQPSLQQSGFGLENYDEQFVLFHEQEKVRDKMLHAVLTCHLGELILLCAQYTDIPMTRFWQQVRHDIETIHGPTEQIENWLAERHHILEKDWPAKSFTHMRLANESEDIMGKTPSPMRSEAGLSLT